MRLTEAPPAISPAPEVTLVNAFTQPFNNAVATARTCYSSRVVTPEDVDRDERSRAQRDAIARSTYEAGHHTTLQHATFQFVLEKVSRQFLWSFLHSHPYYNSEQVSQRYVTVKADQVAVPSLSDAQREAYAGAVRMLMEAYERLVETLGPTVRDEYAKLFRNRKPESQKRWGQILRRKAQEAARYVLPVATHAHLYHTVNGITLHRYHRLCGQLDVPQETRLVVGRMVEEVTRFDPLFFRAIEDPMPIEETLEYRMLESLQPGPSSTREFLDEFDRDLGGRVSKLVDWKANAEATLAQGVRSVLGLQASAMSDDEAIDWVLNPARNPYLSESLTLTTMGKATRALSHPHFSFRKKLSHTADSQDQRHRMVPGSRPVLSRHFLADRPDYVVPALIAACPSALADYRQVMEDLWGRMRRLLEMGAGEEAVLYLLPNAFPIRFEESGDLLNLHHKWVHRLCYTAQEEIWAACRDEVLQVKALFPRLARHLLPPCNLRKDAGVTPYCPEGDRYCGVPVWKIPVAQYRRIL